jgi:hypothetical protein
MDCIEYCTVLYRDVTRLSLQVVGEFLLDCMVLHPRRQCASVTAARISNLTIL